MRELFISPKGNDTFSGTLPSPNKTNTDGPLLTLAAARDRVRKLKLTGQLEAPFTVHIRGGRYPVTTPIVFTPDDSGPITYAAYKDEVPLFDGSQPITGFRTEKLANGLTAWVADLPDVAAGRWYFRSLFVDGQRRPRTLLPKDPAGKFEIIDVPEITRQAALFEGTTNFITRREDAKPYHNLTDIDVLVPHYWVEERMPIASWNPDTGKLTSTRRSIFALRLGFGPEWASYRLENVFEAFDTPGQWYLDRPAGKLYYLPKRGEKLNRTPISAPRARQFIRLEGNLETQQHVEYLTFRGLTFANTDWQQSPGVVPEHDKIPPVLMASDGQAAVGVEGVINAFGARYCTFEGLTVHTIGEYALNFTQGCAANRIIGCHLHDLGGGGIKVYGAPAARPRHLYCSHFQITDNHIHDIGEVFKPAIGIITCHSFGNMIAHNHIHHTHYTGISVGWVWGYAENVSRDNLIEKNHIHHIGKGALSDMGGIYTLGVQPGTVIRGNHIHDVRTAQYGGWAIYPDEGSSHMIIENNVCYDTDSTVFNTHYGRELIVRNNIFALGRECAMSLGRFEGHNAFTLTGNIILTDGQPLFHGPYNGSLQKPAFRSDHNLLFDLSHRTPAGGVDYPSHGGQTHALKALQSFGLEVHSKVADPLFRNVKKRDFTLKPNSPALALGFQPIDLSDVGPRMGPRKRRR